MKKQMPFPDKIKIYSIILVLVFSMMVLPTGAGIEKTESPDSPEFPYPGDEWAWDMIGTEYAHQMDVYGEDVVVAVLDSGIDYTHPDLEDKMWDDIGYDFVDNDDDPMDEHGHGTHVAGIIASVAPGAELMALRVIEERGGDWVDVSRAVEYARDNGADIISMSFGGQYSIFTPAFELQMDRAYNWDDILHVAAAGNDDSEEKFYPAGYDSVMSVSALDSDMEKAHYSNYGDWIEIAAPGGGSLDQVHSTLPDDSYGEMMGTSMACPFVTGAAALRRSIKPEESNEEVREFLQDTAIDLGNDEYYGHGLVNAYRAAGGEVPTPVQDLDADSYDARVELTWDEPWHHGAEPIEGFKIYRGEYEEELEPIAEIGPEQHNYEDTEVDNEVTYQYMVRAYNDLGESFDSEIVSVTPRDEETTPSPPSEVDAELLGDGIHISWKEPLDDGGSPIQRYHLYRKEEGAEEFKALSEVDQDVDEYLDTTISLGKEYTYGITAENEIGESERALTEQIYVPEDHGPSPPKEVTAEFLDEGVKVSWEHPEENDDISHYNIYRDGPDTEDYEFITQVGSGTNSYLDETVSPDSEYVYGVTSENELAESEISYSDTVEVPADHESAIVAPSTPRNVSVELVDEGVSISWREPLEDGGSSIERYTIYRKEEGEEDFDEHRTVSAETRSYLDTTIEPGSDYIYGVTAENEEGESQKANTSTISVPDDYTLEDDDDVEGIGDWLTDNPIILLMMVGIGIVIFGILAWRIKSKKE